MKEPLSKRATKERRGGGGKQSSNSGGGFVDVDIVIITVDFERLFLEMGKHCLIVVN